MAKKPPPIPASQQWLCEGCGWIEEDIHPPDSCAVCDHEYFENLADLIEERDDSTLH